MLGEKVIRPGTSISFASSWKVVCNAGPCRAHRASAIWTDDPPTTSCASFDLDYERRRDLLGSGETFVDAYTTVGESTREQVHCSGALDSGWSRTGLYDAVVCS